MALKEDISLIYRSKYLLRGAFKFVLFGTTLFSYFLFTSPFLLTGQFMPVQTKRWQLKVIGLYARFCVWFMGIGVEFNSEGNWPHGLIVCNHLSYIDVLILASLRPACFVTSVEIKETPVLGQISSLAGCLFVERRNKTNLSQEIKELTQALKMSIPVVIFPEATSTNGESVLRFRRPLFQSAIDAHVPVVPLTLNYQTVDGERVSQANRDLLCWYGDMSFVPHLWNFLKIKQTLVTIDMAETIVSSDLDTLVQESHLSVSQKFKPFY